MPVAKPLANWLLPSLIVPGEVPLSLTTWLELRKEAGVPHALVLDESAPLPTRCWFSYVMSALATRQYWSQFEQKPRLTPERRLAGVNQLQRALEASDDALAGRAFDQLDEMSKLDLCGSWPNVTAPETEGDDWAARYLVPEGAEPLVVDRSVWRAHWSRIHYLEQRTRVQALGAVLSTERYREKQPRRRGDAHRQSYKPGSGRKREISLQQGVTSLARGFWLCTDASAVPDYRRRLKKCLYLVFPMKEREKLFKLVPAAYKTPRPPDLCWPSSSR